MPVVVMLVYFNTYPFSKDRDPTVAEWALAGIGLCSAMIYVTWQSIGLKNRFERAFPRKK